MKNQETNPHLPPPQNPERKDPAKNKNPSFEVEDFRAKYDEDKEQFTNFKPKRFIPHVQPEIDLFSTITIYGKRRTGKSVFVKWFLQSYKQYFPWLWVFTKTRQNSHYATFVPEKFIIPEFNADVLHKIMERQIFGIKKYTEQNQDENPRAVIIWDDYSGNDIRFNNSLNEYYFTGRHYATMNFFCAQHVTLTPPAIRSNTDVVIIFNSDYKNSIKAYNECFAGKLDPNFFKQMMVNYCEDVPHGFMAIVNNPNVKAKDKYFFGLAEELPVSIDYIVGCKEYWRGSEKQLTNIINGTLAKRIDLIQRLSKPQGQEGNRETEETEEEHEQSNFRQPNSGGSRFGSSLSNFSRV
jgi:hypothetical protein